MFDRYSEKARRAVFFARYEASQFGASEITPEHFLLGALREDGSFGDRVSLAAIRKRIEEVIATQPKVSTSVDMPLSDAMKRVLGFSAEAADRLHQKEITIQHHLLGLLREPCFASDLMREFGLDEAAIGSDAPPPLGPKPKAAILEGSVQGLYEMVRSGTNVVRISGGISHVRFDPDRREPISHLIDCAAAFHQWLSTALTSNVQTFQAPARGRLTTFYETAEWRTLFDLWLQMNKLLLHFLCEIEGGAAETIAPAAAVYVNHCMEVARKEAGEEAS